MLASTGRVATLVVVEAVLFSSSGSGVPDETTTVLSSEPGAVAVAMTLMVAVVPLTTAPRLQVTTPAARTQAPWLEAAETKVTPAGKVSTSVTGADGSFPGLVMAMAYVTLLPSA